MAMLIASTRQTAHGTYVVPGPVRTDAIGDILRASFTAKDDAAAEMLRLLAVIDRRTSLS